jgi:hypothetical protein
MNENCTLWTLRVERLKAFSLLRFFVALDKEMTRRHAQWLIERKKSVRTERAKTLKAATRHRPKTTTTTLTTPLTPPDFIQS